MIDEYLDLAVSAARAAGDYLKKRGDIQIDADEAHDLKISADKNSEKIIIDLLSPSGLAVLAEESGAKEYNDGLCWIVDPIDGTVNYFKGADELCCVSIALFKGDDPVLGVVYRFAVDELFTGVVGRGAFLNGKPFRTSGVTRLADTVMATGFPSKYEYTAENISKFIAYVQRVKKVRMLGTAALMGTFAACGRVDLYFEEDIRLWDVAGAMAITLSAGGAVKLKRQPNDKLHRCIFVAAATNELLEEFENA
jgi:myo-inositol-1(or 4)-monophosphatase